MVQHHHHTIQPKGPIAFIGTYCAADMTQQRSQAEALASPRQVGIQACSEATATELQQRVASVLSSSKSIKPMPYRLRPPSHHSAFRAEGKVGAGSKAKAKLPKAASDDTLGGAQTRAPLSMKQTRNGIKLPQVSRCVYTSTLTSHKVISVPQDNSYKQYQVTSLYY